MVNHNQQNSYMPMPNQIQLSVKWKNISIFSLTFLGLFTMVDRFIADGGYFLAPVLAPSYSNLQTMLFTAHLNLVRQSL